MKTFNSQLLAGVVGFLALASLASVDAAPVGPSPKKIKKVYVIQYKTRGWVKIAYQFQKTKSELIGQGVNGKMAEAKALGFATKREIDKTTVLFGTDSYRTYAYAKADRWHEKTFKTKAERDAFKRKIYKIVPSYTNNGPGLNTKELER